MSNSDPVKNLVYPQFNVCSVKQPPQLPSSWQCTALLHPFSPPPKDDPKPDNPFFNLCVASIAYVEGEELSAQIASSDGRTWWYLIKGADNSSTTLSTDKGTTWNSVDVGWTLPSTNWLEGATCVGNSYLNWMKAQKVDWWKKPASENTNPNAATWFWFNSDGNEANFPFRMMFGAPPPQPNKGTIDQLALLQMYSFTYFAKFSEVSNPIPTVWKDPAIEGFTFGNPQNLKPVVWNTNFGMTTFMTPVDHASNPLPTRVLYRWASEQDYKSLTDRAQSTYMLYTYNTSTYNPNSENPGKDIEYQEAFMYGVAPNDFNNPPSDEGCGFLYTKSTIQGDDTCQKLTDNGVNLGQEPPDWASIEGGYPIQAIISNHPSLCPKQTITVLGVIFPPTNEYPQGRYLWTWYSPFSLSQDSSHCRPVTFMESASNIAEGGTSLALADYYNYAEFDTEINSDYFQLPDICQSSPSNTTAIYSNYKHSK